MQRLDFKIHMDSGLRRGMAGIDPACADAGIVAALDVRGQAVAHHQSLFGIKAGNPGKGCIEIGLRGLVVADFFGHKHLLKEG